MGFKGLGFKSLGLRFEVQGVGQICTESIKSMKYLLRVQMGSRMCSLGPRYGPHVSYRLNSLEDYLWENLSLA